MTKNLIKYNNREVPAILLARFDMVDNEFVSVKGLFGRIKDIFTPIQRQYCLVFIPWKHKEKEHALISMSDVITMDKLIGNDIVSVERKCRVSHTHFRQLSSSAASEVASSEVSAIAEVKFAPHAAQV